VAERSQVKPARSDLIAASRLGAHARRALLERTYALESRIFRNVESFEDYARRALAASELWVWALEDPGGQLVGYNVITYDEYDHRGTPIGVYRANVGLLPDFRGHNRTVATGLRLAIPRLLRHPGRRLYFHSYLQHPSIYVMMEKYSEIMWPTPRTDPPSADALELIGFLESQGSAPPRWDPASPWVVRLPTSVIEGDEEIDAWLRSSRPSARYFFDKNPHYRDGGALTILVPLTMANLLRAVGRVMTQQFQRRRS
jgi:hypothetical protein